MAARENYWKYTTEIDRFLCLNPTSETAGTFLCLHMSGFQLLRHFHHGELFISTNSKTDIQPLLKEQFT